MARPWCTPSTHPLSQKIRGFTKQFGPGSQSSGKELPALQTEASTEKPCTLEEGLEAQAGPAAKYGSLIAGTNLFLPVIATGKAPRGPENCKSELLLPLVFTPTLLNFPHPPPPHAHSPHSTLGGPCGAGDCRLHQSCQDSTAPFAET